MDTEAPTLYGCWSLQPQQHPWNDIADTACGYDTRETDSWCTGCHRQRAESALEQLQQLDSRHTQDGLLKEVSRGE